MWGMSPAQGATGMGGIRAPTGITSVGFPPSALKRSPAVPPLAVQVLPNPVSPCVTHLLATPLATSSGPRCGSLPACCHLPEGQCQWAPGREHWWPPAPPLHPGGASGLGQRWSPSVFNRKSFVSMSASNRLLLFHLLKTLIGPLVNQGRMSD